MNLSPGQLAVVRSWGDGALEDLAEREALMSEGGDRRCWREAFVRECLRHGMTPIEIGCIT